jgi:hypothetical protein
MNSDVVRCSECVRSGKTLKWPHVWVESEPFGRKPSLSAFVRSVGYLKSAQTTSVNTPIT